MSFIIAPKNRRERRLAKFASIAIEQARLEAERASDLLLRRLVDDPFVQQGHRVNFAADDETVRKIRKLAERRLITLHEVGFLKIAGTVRFGVRVSKPVVKTFEFAA